MRSFLILLLSIISCLAQETVQVTLGWSDNPEPDIAYYKLYFGTGSKVYGDPLLVTINQKTLTLPIGQYHFASVSAVNTSGLECVLRKELCFQVFRPGEGVAPGAPDGPYKLSDISITIEQSSDLKVWTSIHQRQHTPQTLNSFYRLVLRQ